MIYRNRAGRLRYQIGGALIFAVFLPYLIRVTTIQSVTQIQPSNQALFGCIIATIFGTVLFRNISTYPGVEKSAYVLPAFSLAYAALVFVLLMTRLDYNRTIILSGYVITIIWFLALQSFRGRSEVLKVGLLPFGKKIKMEAIPGINWVFLSDPMAPIDGIDAIAADLRSDLPDEWDRRLADFALAGLPVYHTKHLVESLTGQVELEHLSENSFGSLTPVLAFMSTKAVLDWIAAVVALVLLFVPMLLIGLAIRLTSKGPALFLQYRVGYKGKIFTVLKFRTMTVRQEEGVEASKTLENDQRITTIGRFLRRMRIDELPQIVNVLRGEMSWIGPRPEAEALSRWYEAEIPFYRYRHIVKPGITGWAQISQGHVTELGDVQDKLNYDFYYIKHFSPWIDVLIVVRTIKTIMTGFGSR